jgi:DNA primase
MNNLIPRSFIDELLTRVDIVDFIDSYVPLKRRGASHIACCPFHHEKTPSFNVVAKKQFYHCFGCGVSGNVISFVMSYLQQSFPEAIETLATRAGMQVPREGDPEKFKQSQSLYQFLQRVSNFYQQTLKTSGKIAIDYLKQRGVNGEIARAYQLGYAPDAWHTLEMHFKHYIKELIAAGMIIAREDNKTYDRYRQRIIFPIHDRQGRMIGFGGRALSADQKPKYLNSPETIIFQKNRELYGLHQVLQRNIPLTSIVIVEGYMDVIALAQYGILNAVATLGTATSTYHIQLLNKHTKQLVFCFDGDAAGKQAAWRALESCLTQLDSGLDARFVFLPDSHDPDSFIRQEGAERFHTLVQNAIPLSRFFLDILSQSIDQTSLTGKSQLMHAAKPYLSKMADSPYKQLLIDELARVTRIESHRIQQLMMEKTPEKTFEEKNIVRTPIRLATAILLQHPEIYAACSTKIPPSILDENQSQSVLQSLMQQILENSAINTAALIENWRDSPFFEALNKLATWEHQVPENALTKEFTDIVLFLAQQHQEDQIRQLIEKSRRNELTESERHTLQRLLKERHRANETN